jgi:hypothetical protein
MSSGKPKFEDFKLSEYEKRRLVTEAVPRYVRDTGKEAVQIWFELFLEYMERLGYKVEKVSEGSLGRSTEFSKWELARREKKD